MDAHPFQFRFVWSDQNDFATGRIETTCNCFAQHRAGTCDYHHLHRTCKWMRSHRCVSVAIPKTFQKRNCKRRHKHHTHTDTNRETKREKKSKSGKRRRTTGVSNFVLMVFFRSNLLCLEFLREIFSRVSLRSPSISAQSLNRSVAIWTRLSKIPLCLAYCRCRCRLFIYLLILLVILILSRCRLPAFVVVVAVYLFAPNFSNLLLLSNIWMSGYVDMNSIFISFSLALGSSTHHYSLASTLCAIIIIIDVRSHWILGERHFFFIAIYHNTSILCNSILPRPTNRDVILFTKTIQMNFGDRFSSLGFCYRLSSSLGERLAQKRRLNENWMYEFCRFKKTDHSRARQFFCLLFLRAD